MTSDASDMKLVNLDPPIPKLSQAAEEEILALAQRQKKAAGILMKGINFVGGQVEDTLKLLPDGTKAQVDKVAKDALRTSYDVAAKSRTGRWSKINECSFNKRAGCRTPTMRYPAGRSAVARS